MNQIPYVAIAIVVGVLLFLWSAKRAPITASEAGKLERPIRFWLLCGLLVGWCLGNFPALRPAGDPVWNGLNSLNGPSNGAVTVGTTPISAGGIVLPPNPGAFTFPVVGDRTQIGVPDSAAGQQLTFRLPNGTTGALSKGVWKVPAGIDLGDVDIYIVRADGTASAPIRL